MTEKEYKKLCKERGITPPVKPFGKNGLGKDANGKLVRMALPNIDKVRILTNLSNTEKFII